jgi:uncharacterized protein (DUF427 family)
VPGVSSGADAVHLSVESAARYDDVAVEGAEVSGGAWSYPDPRPSAIDLVGKDFSRYVAFDPGQVDIRE